MNLDKKYLCDRNCPNRHVGCQATCEKYLKKFNANKLRYEANAKTADCVNAIKAVRSGYKRR